MEFIEDGFGWFPPFASDIWRLPANLAFYRILGRDPFERIGGNR